MTPSEEIDHSDLPPPIVSSESVDRQVRGDLCGIASYPVTVSSESVDWQVRGDQYSSEISEEQLLTKPTQIPKPNKIKNHEQVRWDPLYSDIPEWLQEFRENLVDDRVPEHRDSHASSSHEPSLQPMRSVDLGLLVTVCPFKTSPSVRPKRLRMYRQHAHMLKHHTETET